MSNRKLTTYADAFESARKKCEHTDLLDLVTGRQYYCEDCHRILTRAEVVRMQRQRGWWGFGS